MFRRSCSPAPTRSSSDPPRAQIGQHAGSRLMRPAETLTAMFDWFRQSHSLRCSPRCLPRWRHGPRALRMDRPAFSTSPIRPGIATRSFRLPGISSTRSVRQPASKSPHPRTSQRSRPRTCATMARTNPLVAFLGRSIAVTDEIYQIRDFDVGGSHVLLRLDPNSVELRRPNVRRHPYGWPLAWTRSYGSGRIFYAALGHEIAVWRSLWFQQMLRNAALWVLRRAP